GELPADRVQQQVAVRADPAAEDHQLYVGDRGERGDVQRYPPCDLGDDGPRCLVALARGAEDGARIGGAAGERRDLRSGGIDAVKSNQREIDLARGAVAAAMELAAEDDACAHARADREEDEIVDAVRNSLPLLTERGEVDVVLERDRQAEGALQLARECSTFETADVLGQPQQAGPFLDDARDADDDALDAAGIEPRRLEQRRVQALARLHRTCHLGDGELDVLTRADLPGQIADGAAHEARAEVETEHDRGFGHRLEVDGAVARAVGAVSRLTDEVGLEQRLEDERDRRLRDARAPGDLRPRDRRAGADRLEHGALVQVAE